LKDIVETNGRTDGRTDGLYRLLYFLANAVGWHSVDRTSPPRCTDIGGVSLIHEKMCYLLIAKKQKWKQMHQWKFCSISNYCRVLLTDS